MKPTIYCSYNFPLNVLKPPAPHRTRGPTGFLCRGLLPWRGAESGPAHDAWGDKSTWTVWFSIRGHFPLILALGCSHGPWLSINDCMREIARRSDSCSLEWETQARYGTDRLFSWRPVGVAGMQIAVNYPPPKDVYHQPPVKGSRFHKEPCLGGRGSTLLSKNWAQMTHLCSLLLTLTVPEGAAGSLSQKHGQVIYPPKSYNFALKIKL